MCAGDLGCDGGEVAVSSKGIAGCVEIAGDDVGVGYEWGPSILWTPAFLADLHVMFSGCSVADYEVSASSSANTAAVPDGARSVTVGRGLPFAVFRIVGTDASPHVTLTAPDGSTIDATAATASQSATGAVLHVAPQKLTLVIVNKPKPGKWTITPAADSSPLASVGHADGLPAPRVSAKVSGKGRARTLSYRIKPIRGQKVRFEERGAIGKAGANLGYAKGNVGRLRFTSADGPAGRRTIYALVESFGTPRKQLKVATYTAPPPPRPSKVRALKLRRSGATVVVSWKSKGIKVSRYRLLIKLSDGRVLLLLPKGGAHRATLANVGKRVRVTAVLRGELSSGVAGPAVSARAAK